MKINKLSLTAALALGGLLACSTMTFAQDAKAGKEGRRGGFGNPQQRIERLSTELNLSADQKTKLTAFFEEQGKKMQELRDLAPEERRTKFQAFREEEIKKMKEVLTPEQFEKWEKMRAEMRRPGGPGGEKKGGEKKSE